MKFLGSSWNPVGLRWEISCGSTEGQGSLCEHQGMQCTLHRTAQDQRYGCQCQHRHRQRARHGSMGSDSHSHHRRSRRPRRLHLQPHILRPSDGVSNACRHQETHSGYRRLAFRHLRQLGRLASNYLLLLLVQSCFSKQMPALNGFRIRNRMPFKVPVEVLVLGDRSKRSLSLLPL